MRKLTIHVTRGGNVLPDRGFCLMDPNGDVYVAYRQDDPNTCWQYAEEVYSKPRQTLEAQGWAVVEVELPNAQPDNAHFGQQVGMQAMAEPIVRRRSESLNSDVDHCIHREPYAPFPALLYCFATVDCLAALYAGNTGKGQQGANARVYMTEVMTYTEEQVRLLQAVYRHKLVHLAEPKSVIADAGRLVSWRYVHPRDEQHLSLTTVRAWVVVTPKWHVLCDHEFFISIRSFADDIIRSATAAPDGYLSRLARDPAVQANFVRAFGQISDPYDG